MSCFETSSPPILLDSPDLLMIALYYWYIDIPTESLDEQVSYHQSLCKNLNLFGRIRISTEGLNGVLSGTRGALMEYECQIRDEIEGKFRIYHQNIHEGEDIALKYGQTLDVKYCHLREDIPQEKQLFDSLSVKVTKEVVSLNEPLVESNECNSDKTSTKKRKSRKKNKGERYEQIMEEDRLRKEQEQQQIQQQDVEGEGNGIAPLLEKQALSNIDNFEPATHLSPKEWNEHLLSYSINDETSDSQSNITSKSDAILIDARNIYESKIGYFSSQNVPTLLTNTRKYSTITSVLNESIHHMAGKNVYMYCTGGVRCERASVYLQALANSEAWPEGLKRPKSIYQLEGGIQKYLEQYGTLERNKLNDIKVSTDNDGEGDNRLAKCLFKGKNFVFDPRRFDPMVGNVEKPVGQCIVCSCPFDDYDNSHAPCDNMEARCCRCRVLVLVCNDCRLRVRIWGQDKQHNHHPDLFCGESGKECVNEGNCIDHVEIINA